MADEIALSEQWTEVVVAESEKEPLADEVARLAEERRLTGVTTITDEGKMEIAGVQLPRTEAFDILGELMAKPPTFADYVKKRAMMTAPVVRKVPLQKASDYSISFGPVYGERGTTTTLMVQPQCYFRGEKIIAQDTAGKPGFGTALVQLLVGRKLQFAAGRGAIMTAMFGNDSLGRGIKLDTCQPAFGIAATISFVSACTFAMTIFGKAVL